MTTVVTFKCRRRQDLGDGNFREYGELIPEAHTWFAGEHYLHTGELEEVEVDDAELRKAIEAYCPQLSGQILERLGLVDGMWVEGTHATPRAAPLTQSRVHEGLNPRTAKRPAKTQRRQKRPPTVKQGESTIIPTDVRPGVPSARRAVTTRRKS